MDKKEQIIKTAIRLFVKQGFENTPTSQISKEADVATGTLFHHFKTKEDLLNEAYLHVKRTMISSMGVDSSSSVKESLRKSWISTFEYGLKNKREVSFMVIFSGSKYITKETQIACKKIFKPFTDIFARGKKEKAMKDLPQEILENVYYSIMKSVFTLKPSKDVIEKGFEMVWDALRR